MLNSNKTKINIISGGGCGDMLLSLRLKSLLNLLYSDKYNVTNYLCSRDETWNMIKTLFPNDKNIKKLDEKYLDNIKSQEDLDIFEGKTYICYPDKLFRGLGAPPLKEWNITNFLVKQTRLLIGKYRSNNFISLALNSITAGYTFHSIKELAINLAKAFPDKTIYLPLISRWNGNDLHTLKFSGCPSNLLVEYDAEFPKVYDILCQSDYLITTDSAMMHIGWDMAIPMLVLDPQFDRIAFSARWRPIGYYNSIPIESLVEDVIDIVKTQLVIPETQMIGADKIFRKGINNWLKELIFKE